MSSWKFIVEYLSLTGQITMLNDFESLPTKEGKDTEDLCKKNEMWTFRY